ncbi:hypothetical protein [Lacipirellula limnantheis]|uniref:hypothetical protein n=1 Tax=Lacipirellula limnantheis TaxID=2528024 RepID=UPI00143D60CC|nr:hypothetical protein [Lacipirellula limnantheis]
MHIPPHSPHAELAYCVIFAFAAGWWIVAMVRNYGWAPWRWPWGTWLRRRPPD